VRVSGSVWAYAAEFLRHPRAITLRRASRGLGDNLLLSCLAREVKRADPGRRVFVETAWPELFLHNPNVDAVFTRKVSPAYHKIAYRIDPGTREHLIDQMVRQLPFPVAGWERTVDLFLPGDPPGGAAPDLPHRFIAVNPAGKGGHSANRKEWGIGNFAALRERLAGTPFVQIGDPATPLLPGAEDRRGRPVLESAAILARSATGVFLEGGMMHLAEAVRKPSVIVFGGMIRPEVSGYDRHENIATRPECGPCFTSHTAMTVCESMVCMKEIPVERVTDAVKRILERGETAASASARAPAPAPATGRRPA
jgi:ADP-heptose:LPS heptosyltransferase